MLKGILKKAGLNDKEVLVYLSLLELGSQPVSTIGKKANINRSTTYLILDNLMKKGYINQHIRADVKYFTAADPQVIVQNLEIQEKELKEVRSEIVDHLPEFYSLTNPLSVKPKVRFYEGEEGVKRAMEDTLSATETLLCFVSVNSWLNSTPGLQKYFREYAKLRVHKHKIPEKVLAVETDIARKYLLKEYPGPNPLLEIKWIPKTVSPFKNEINIYNDKVSLVSLAKNELLGIVIESHEIAKTHKAFFEMAWKAGKPK